MGPVAHRMESNGAPGARHRLHVESRTLVAHHQPCCVRSVAKVEVNRHGAGVLHRIVEGLLRDPQHGQLLVRRKPVAVVDPCLDCRLVDPA